VKTQDGTETNQDYVSVDDLLSETLDELDMSEPYDKTNIEVGLAQFAENEAGVDVDENGSMSTKLDLAKMYIEIGDEENAQVELLAVISKGDATQQAEAQTLLDSL
jgi:pilus assembly protein FimV